MEELNKQNKEVSDLVPVVSFNPQQTKKLERGHTQNTMSSLNADSCVVVQQSKADFTLQWVFIDQ